MVTNPLRIAKAKCENEKSSQKLFDVGISFVHIHKTYEKLMKKPKLACILKSSLVE